MSNEPKERVIRQPVRIANKGRKAGAEAACRFTDAPGVIVQRQLIQYIA